MTCTECRSQSEDFAYCNRSICGLPVCSQCAVLHALKETFRKFPLSDKQKNMFFNRILADYKILQKVKI